jgi:hypothetical protein
MGWLEGTQIVIGNERELRVHRMKSFLLVGICGLSLTNSFINGQERKAALEPTVCSIAATPGRFDGKIVSVFGQIESDGIERTVLTDSGCVNLGIAISAPAHFKGEAEFTKALDTGHPGTLDKKITGTFVGKFVWKPREVPKRILELKEVRNLSIVMK